MSDVFMDVSEEQEQEIANKVRLRNTYVPILRAFWDSGRNTVQINLDEGTLGGRKAQSVKTSFENARKHDTTVDIKDKVRVIKDGDNVYLQRAPGA